MDIPSIQKYFRSALGGILSFLERKDGGTDTKTTRLRNPPDISTLWRSGLCYVTTGLCTWQKRRIVLRIGAYMALLTASIRHSKLWEAERLQTPKRSRV